LSGDGRTRDVADFKLDFTGIGVFKAGTTWIAHCLGEHPSVCMAQGKETNFFLRKHISSALPVRRYHYGMAHYDDGFDWYSQKFSHHQAGQLRGEFSNAYLADPESARLLHEHNPAMKILCCFRNPVDVTYAGYFQLGRVQPLPGTVEETLDRYPQLLEYCRYHQNLQPFLKLFPRERIHFMLYDDIKTDPAGLYGRLCEFLAIDSSFVPEALNQRVNPRMVLRSRTVRNVRAAIGHLMASTPTSLKVRAGLVRLGVFRLAVKLFQLNEKPGSVPPLALETRRRLVEFFREDNEALGRLIGRDLSHWSAV
jgi:hypothetical protein